MKGYKAFTKDLTCRDMQYEIGKTYEMEAEPIVCEQGFHFCKNIADVYKFYEMSDDTRICEISATGEIDTEDNIKYCTNKIEIIREITDKNIKHCNMNGEDVGYCNIGRHNSGHYNSGHHNSGHHNSGEYNLGRFNSGNRNLGGYNSGNCNSGSCNTGSYNSGYYNSGSCNSGRHNSGYYNSGYSNTGYFNSGDYNTGCFNTELNPKIKFFDKESEWTFDDWLYSNAKAILSTCPCSHSDFINENEMTEEEKESHSEYKAIGGYIKEIIITKEDKQKWWDSLQQEDKEECFKLPNFDEKKFCKCIGIEHI